MSNTLLKNKTLTQAIINDVGKCPSPYQFYGFYWDSDISLPANLEYISDNSFSSLTQYNNVNHPTCTCNSNLKAIGNNGFSVGQNAKIILNNGLEYLGDSTFKNLGRFVTVSSFDIPDSVIYIGKECFYSSGIQSFNWSSNCKTIRNSVFYNNTNLTSITNLDNVKTILMAGFQGCKIISDIYLPSIEWMDNYTFSGCTGLTTVTLGPDCGFISTSVFQSCTSLTTINVIGDENCKTAQTLATLTPAQLNNATIVYDYTPPSEDESENENDSNDGE